MTKLLKNYLTVAMSRKNLSFNTLSDIMENESATLAKLTQTSLLKAIMLRERSELILEKHGIL